MDLSKSRESFSSIRKGLPHRIPEEEIIEIYKGWATTYDMHCQGKDQAGYVGTLLGSEKAADVLLTKNINKNSRIIDLGAGTGHNAQVLKKNGFDNIDAVDITQAMLDIAKEKGLYKRLICQSLDGSKLPCEDGEYDVATAIGVFAPGHVHPMAFDEILRIVKPGGLILFTVRGDYYDSKEVDFAGKVKELESSNRWTVEHVSEMDYSLSMGEEKQRIAYWHVCVKSS